MAEQKTEDPSKAKKRVLQAGADARAKAEAEKKVAEQTPAAAPAAVPEAAKAEVQERKVTPCDNTRLKGVEYLRSDYLYTAYEGTRPDDLLAPEHFAHVSTQLRPRDRIEAWAHDGTWMAEFVVLESGRNWTRTAKVGEFYFTARDTAITQASVLDPYLIEYTGPSTLWRVVRKADKQVLHDGEQTQEAAITWLAEHVKAFR